MTAVEDLWWEGDDLHVITEDGLERVYHGAHFARMEVESTEGSPVVARG